MDVLITFLTQVRERIARNAYPNETAVRSQIVQPILERLGWPVYDADKVCHEYSLKWKGSTRRVDLALCMSNGGSPRCIIELKGPDHVEGDEQLFEYAFHAGAPLALLTNGAQWRFYYIPTGGTYDERLVRTIDLREHIPAEAAQALDRYLSCPNTESGAAAECAKEDLDKRINRDRARQKIPVAWKNLTEADPDDRLVNLLIGKTSSISDYAPAKSDVVNFLRSLGSSALLVSDHPDDTPPPAPPPPGSTTVSRPQAIRNRQQEQGSIHYQLNGTAYETKNAKSAFVDIITKLAEQDDSFLDRLAPKLQGRKVNGLARRKSDLTHREAGRRSAAQLPSDWWLYTQLSNSANVRVLKTACSVADIAFDNPDGLKITLPNA